MIEKAASVEYQWQNVGHQYFAAIAANLIMLGHGTIIGWVSPALPILASENTPLKDGPLNSSQISWLGSMLSIGAILGTFIFGSLCPLLGCKRTMIFLALPSIIFWFLIEFGQTYDHILIARLICGMTGGGIMATLVLYVSDISNNNIRGKLGCLSNLIRNVGILMSYSVGAVVDYEYLPRIFIIIQIVYVLVFSYLPNTPQFHMHRGQFQEAEKSLKYYKGYDGKTEQEINALNKEMDQLKAIVKERQIDEKLHFKDFCEKDAIRGLMVGLVIAIISQLTGGFTFISYAVMIFQKTESSIDPHVQSIISAIVQILGTLCSAQLADSLGRKLLTITSLVGAAIGNLTLALYMYLHINGYDVSAFTWIPVVSISFVMFIISAGIISLTGILTVECLPPKIRGIGLVICVIGLNSATFFCVKFFPILIDIIELHGCLIIFATGCLFGAIFLYVVMQETKGKSMDTLKK